MKNETEKEVHRLEGVLGRVLAVATLGLVIALVGAGIVGACRYMGILPGECQQALASTPSSTEAVSRPGDAPLYSVAWELSTAAVEPAEPVTPPRKHPRKRPADNHGGGRAHKGGRR